MLKQAAGLDLAVETITALGARSYTFKGFGLRT